jgi:hypothetical protein
MVPDHIGELHICVIDHVTGAQQCERRFVVEVLASAARPLMRLRKQRHGLAPAVAAFLATREAPLGGIQRTFGLPVPTRRVDARAV